MAAVAADWLDDVVELLHVAKPKLGRVVFLSLFPLGKQRFRSDPLDCNVLWSSHTHELCRVTVLVRDLQPGGGYSTQIAPVGFSFVVPRSKAGLG